MSWVNKSNQSKKSTEEKFWEKVDICGDDECWEWLAGKFYNGYGQFRFNNTKMNAQRVAWILTNGEIPEHGSYHGLCVCHTCDNRSCCNPEHLFLGTAQDNVNDRNKKGRQAYGEASGNSKLTWKEIDKIRKLYDTEMYTQVELGEMFNTTQANISSVIRRESWKKAQ